MKTLILNAHPNPGNSHTQQFLYEALGGQATYVDLSQEDPEVSHLKDYDRIIFQFPLYWYGAPARLKDWLDQKLTGKEGFLAGKDLGLVVAFDTPEKDYGAGAKNRYTVSEMLRPYEMLANFFGMDYLPPFSLFQWRYLSPEEQWEALVAYRLYVLGPKRPSFAQKGAWLLQELAHIEGSQLLSSYLSDQLDELADLNDLLKGEQA